MARDTWDPRRLPDLTGRRYLVTGSNTGLGFFATLQLTGAGAHVLMTGRNPARLSAARAAVLRQHQDARLETVVIDTSNLGSVRSAAATVRGRNSRAPLDGLLLNAGVVHPPKERQTTGDGHELIFATNVLGHYALAGELLPSLAAARGRMVWVGSMSTSLTPYDPIDPELENGYSAWTAYVQSKVATTALGLEADRRLRAEHVDVASLIAHPGYATRGRTRGIVGVNEPSKTKRFVDNLQAAFAQSKEHGAWPLVRALVDPAAESGQFWGPARITAGPPRPAAPAKITRDRDIAARLWHYCEHATRVPWPWEKARKAGQRER